MTKIIAILFFASSLFYTAQAIDAIVVPLSNASYVCPENYTYSTVEDFQLHDHEDSDICISLYGHPSRLLGGGYVYHTVETYFDACPTQNNDPNLLEDALCIKTTIKNASITDADQCPQGSARASVAEIAANVTHFCDLFRQVDEWDIARIGFLGSLDGPAYGCKWRDYDARSLGASVCVTRQIEDWKVVNSGEAVCGKNRAPVTVQDAFDNQEALCALLGQYDIIRLAGGGSMDGPAYGCHIRDTDTRQLGGILCGAVKTQEDIFDILQ